VLEGLSLPERPFVHAGGEGAYMSYSSSKSLRRAAVRARDCSRRQFAIFA
jgi:hypothetical protein